MVLLMIWALYLDLDRIQCINTNNENNYSMTFDLISLASSGTLQKEPSCSLIAHLILNGVIFSSVQHRELLSQQVGHYVCSLEYFSLSKQKRDFIKESGREER